MIRIIRKEKQMSKNDQMNLINIKSQIHIYNKISQSTENMGTSQSHINDYKFNQ